MVFPPFTSLTHKCDITTRTPISCLSSYFCFPIPTLFFPTLTFSTFSPKTFIWGSIQAKLSFLPSRQIRRKSLNLFHPCHKPSQIMSREYYSASQNLGITYPLYHICPYLTIISIICIIYSITKMYFKSPPIPLLNSVLRDTSGIRGTCICFLTHSKINIPLLTLF